MAKEIEIPEGYEARIEGNKVIFVPKESEDEKIRKELLEEIEFIIPHDDETDSEGLILPSYHARIDRYKSYLEKQKEQKPTEWSGEDTKRVKQLIYDTEHIRAEYEKRKKELGESFNDKLIKDCDEQIAWLKSLRPQPHWKPSEEQMKWLKDVIETVPMTCRQQVPLESLYNDLKKLL